MMVSRSATAVKRFHSFSYFFFSEECFLVDSRSGARTTRPVSNWFWRKLTNSVFMSASVREFFSLSISSLLKESSVEGDWNSSDHSLTRQCLGGQFVEIASRFHLERVEGTLTNGGGGARMERSIQGETSEMSMREKRRETLSSRDSRWTNRRIRLLI